MTLAARFGGTPRWWREQAAEEDWGTACRRLREEQEQTEEE